jgi:hypothetical protein
MIPKRGLGAFFLFILVVGVIVNIVPLILTGHFYR